MRKVVLTLKENQKYQVIKKLVATDGNKERARIKLGLKSIRQINRLIAVENLLMLYLMNKKIKLKMPILDSLDAFTLAKKCKLMLLNIFGLVMLRLSYMLLLMILLVKLLLLILIIKKHLMVITISFIKF